MDTPPEIPFVLDDGAVDELPASNQATARKAKAILQELEPARFRDPGSARGTIAAAFAEKGFVVYGKAFDVVELTDPAVILSEPSSVKIGIEKKTICLVEVKSTSGERDDEFRNHFFSLSTAELLVAQSLKDLYKFAFVNTTTKGYRLVTLKQVYERAKAIYPTWSIRFDDGAFSDDP